MPSVKPTPEEFASNAIAALGDSALQHALAELPKGLAAKRERAKAALPEFEALRRVGRNIKDHVLDNLDLYLEAFENNALAAGSHVHWASTAQEACDIIGNICRETGARLVTKGKSMVSEEIGLLADLEASGFNVVETDLGEYIVQLRKEMPSHVMAPAIHVRPSDIGATFRHHHRELEPGRNISTPEALVSEARTVLRDKFIGADVGITGANFLIAETGSAILVTNEGNGDLTQSLPKVHIVLTSIEKVVPTLEDGWALLRILARSASGQEIATYTTITTGPKRPADPDGPEACHIVLLDNGRSELLRSEYRDVLRCIRCGACMNFCPVYGAIGGHAYGSVYSGPIGAVLTPALVGLSAAANLPQASTFCGKCEDVCPVEIPLVGLMRRWREKAFDQDTSWRNRAALRVWAALAKRPALYRAAARSMVAILAVLGRSKGHLKHLPFASAWTRNRDFPAPQGQTFQAQWARQRGGGKR